MNIFTLDKKLKKRISSADASSGKFMIEIYNQNPYLGIIQHYCNGKVVEEENLFWENKIELGNL